MEAKPRQRDGHFAMEAQCPAQATHLFMPSMARDTVTEMEPLHSICLIFVEDSLPGMTSWEARSLLDG
jgi:hypothetical protein